MVEALRGAWPWFVAGPLIGLCVPVLLLIGNKPLGVSGSLRAICAAVAPRGVAFFTYDWRHSGAWSIAFVTGIAGGGMIARALFGLTTPDISASTREAIAQLGFGADVSGFAPSAVFSWSALASWRGLLCIPIAGFLVGFGASYAGGCTSGHGITGLAARDRASVFALLAIFAGGLLATYVLMPALL